MLPTNWVCWRDIWRLERMKTLNHNEQVTLTLRIVAMLDDWRLTATDKIKLLALPEGTRTRSIQKYQQGTPLPFDDTVFTHIDHLLGIGHSLRLANPRNTQAGGLWLHRPHRRFNNRTPMTVMLSEGLSGIIEIRKEIDCSFDWFSDTQGAQNN
jgi:Antitoxin Xre/MbcA/ParS C-terminal toxin-binding domain